MNQVARSPESTVLDAKRLTGRKSADPTGQSTACGGAGMTATSPLVLAVPLDTVKNMIWQSALPRQRKEQLLKDVGISSCVMTALR